MTDQDGTPEPLDGSQEFDDESPIEEEEPRDHKPTPEELAVEAEAEAEPRGDIATDVALTDREAAANDAAMRSTRVERRDVLRWGGRAAAGVAAAALAVGTVLGANALPGERSIMAEPPITHVQPSSALQSRACAGPALRVGTDDGADALALAAIQEPVVTVGSLGGALGQRQLAVPTQEGISGGTAITQRAEPTTLSAAQSLVVDVDDARGLAVSECSETRLDQWLVGGSTRTGRQSTLIIANAAEVSASVDVTVHGPDGPVETVGSTGIAIAPGTETVIDLAAIAPGVADAVVHVASTGAPVAAHLQQITTRGLESGGYDVVDPVSALTAAVLPGVEITEATGVETQPDFDDTVPTLRVLSVGGGAVRIRFQAADGTTVESEGQLEAGRVTDFPLDEIPTGSTTIRVEAETPIVVGARQVAVAAEGNDFDWVAGGQPRSGTSSVAVPPGPGTTVHIASTSDAPQETSVGGQPVQLGPYGTHQQPVPEGSVTITGEALVVAIAYRDASRVGGFTASPQGPTAEGVTVVH